MENTEKMRSDKQLAAARKGAQASRKKRSAKKQTGSDASGRWGICRIPRQQQKLGVSAETVRRYRAEMK